MLTSISNGNTVMGLVLKDNVQMRGYADEVILRIEQIKGYDHKKNIFNEYSRAFCRAVC